MERMTATEAREAIRDMMDAWDTAIKAVMSQGYSETAAQEITGRYFKAKLNIVS